MPFGTLSLERLPAWSLRKFGELNRSLQLAVAFVAIMVVGALDYLTGHEVSLSIGYLAPISIAAWYAGRHAGVACALLCGVSWYVVVRASHASFSHGWIPVWNDAVSVGFFLTHAVLLDAFHHRLRAEQALARIDPLTGMLNFRAFHESLQHAVGLARRHGRTLTLSYVDLDHFKRINDTHGHAEGDRILRLCGRYLRESTRTTDAVARIGGDEFVLLMPDTGADGAEVVISKFHTKLAALRQADGTPVTCSIGAVCFVTLPSSGDEMVEIADKLMYQVKTDGRTSAYIGEYRGTGCKLVKRIAFGRDKR